MKLENRLPLVSVILPVRNEETTIAACLTSIFQQDYPRDRMEIIAADGQSEDSTVQQMLSVPNPGIPFTIIDNPGRIVSSGLNLGIQKARGQVILRVDGHTCIAADYVRQCVLALQRTGAENAGGRMVPRGQGPFGEAAALATSSPFGVGNARFHFSEHEEWVDSVYLGAWPRRVFEKIGLFDEELVRDQDDEFNYRLRTAGGRILLSPYIHSIYTNRSRVRELWQQYFQYGCWKVRVLQKHPRQMCPRQFVPPAFVAGLIVFSLLALFLPGAWIGLAGLAGVYLLANLTAALCTCAKHGWRHLALLPLAYAILHLSYGTGFLSGLLRFYNRWEVKPAVLTNRKSLS